jgi:hypothetical protein
VTALGCFGIAELTRTLYSRQIRRGVWAACFLAAWPFFVGLPILVNYRHQFGKTFHHLPEWHTAISTYADYVGIHPNHALPLVPLVVAVVVIGGLLIRILSWPPAGCEAEPGEIALAAAFTVYPGLLAVCARLTGSGFVPRYGWPGIIGLVLGAVYLYRPAISFRSVAVLLLVFIMLAANRVGPIRDTGPIAASPRWSALADAARSEPDIPVVIGSGLRYLEADQYAPRKVHARLVEVIDEASSNRLLGTDTPDRTNRVLARSVPLRVADLSLFESTTPRFLLYSGGPYDWFTRYLAEQHYPLRALAETPEGTI